MGKPCRVLTPSLDLDSPRFRLLATSAGAGYLLRKAKEYAEVGTPEADAISLAYRCKAALTIYLYEDPHNELPFIAGDEEARR